MWHNIRRINMLTMKNILYHMINQKRLNVIIKMKAYATRFNRAINLHKINIRISKRVLRTIQFQELKHDEWCIIHELKKQFEISNLINATTVFIKKKSKEKKEMCEVQRHKNQSTKEKFFMNEKLFCANVCFR